MPHEHAGAPARAPFFLTTAALFALIAGTELPTPLYPRYQQLFGFSDSVLTLVFAVYALALIPMLIWCGRLADRVGTPPLLAAGMSVAAVGSTMLAAAGDTSWLLAGRVVQGVAVGMATGAATSTLIALRPHVAALWVTVAVAGGGASGPLVAGLLAQYLPWPLHSSYALHALVLAALAIGMSRVRGAFRGPGIAVAPSAARPGIPRDIRVPFARVGLVAFAVWAVGGLYTAVVPTYTAQLLHTDNLALLGAVPFLMLAVATGTQLAGRHSSVYVAQVVGCSALVLGLVALVAAFPTHTLLLIVLSAICCGVGLGAGFLGAQAELQGLAQPERRAELSGAFNICLYLGVALPVIGTGVLADASSLFDAVLVFAVLTALLAATGIAVTLVAKRTANRGSRPVPAPARSASAGR